MPDKYEQFALEYLRLNGYFTIPNFIVHDSRRLRNEMVGNRTESDILAIRMPYSREHTADLEIANDKLLVEGNERKFDIVIGEAKSGDENDRPNPVWRKKDNLSEEELVERLDSIKYLVRFIGVFPDDNFIADAAEQLLRNYHFQPKEGVIEKFPCRFRYIIFASKSNPHYEKIGVQYITHEHIAQFFVKERGQCWLRANIGVASLHSQWSPFLNDIFEIANDQNLGLRERQSKILDFLAAPYPKASCNPYLNCCQIPGRFRKSNS